MFLLYCFKITSLGTPSLLSGSGWVWIFMGEFVFFSSNHAQTLEHTDEQTEVCVVLTGWWSGAPVRGLHPEGESQVLPGCRGAGQSPVLPGAHIWGKGRQSNLHCGNGLIPFEPNNRTRDSGVGSLCSGPWSKCLFAFCSYIIRYSAVLRKVSWKRRCVHPAENAMETRQPYDSSVFRSCKDSAKCAFEAEQTSTEFSRWAFLECSGTDDNSLRWHP